MSKQSALIRALVVLWFGLGCAFWTPPAFAQSEARGRPKLFSEPKQYFLCRTAIAA